MLLAFVVVLFLGSLLTIGVLMSQAPVLETIEPIPSAISNANQPGVAWIVRRQLPGMSVDYAVFIYQGIHWVTDPRQASRFARQYDAECMTLQDDPHISVVRHKFTEHRMENKHAWA